MYTSIVSRAAYLNAFITDARLNRSTYSATINERTSNTNFASKADKACRRYVHKSCSSDCTDKSPYSAPRSHRPATTHPVCILSFTAMRKYYSERSCWWSPRRLGWSACLPGETTLPSRWSTGTSTDRRSSSLRRRDLRWKRGESATEVQKHRQTAHQASEIVWLVRNVQLRKKERKDIVSRRCVVFHR